MDDNTCTGDDEGLSALIASFSQSVAEKTVTDPTERSEMSSYLSKSIVDLIKRWQLPSVTFSSKDISSESWWPVDMTTIKLPVHRDTFEKDFQSVELCSRGSFGVIYRATSVTDNQVYAIKKINIKQSQVDFRKKMREVVFMSRVDSIYVANYKYSWVEKNALSLEDSLYLQMKYYQFTLDTFLEKIFHDIDELEQVTYLHRGFLKHAIVALVFEELVSGVAYLQTPLGKPSIVHGDLKPRNIFIDPSNADIVRIGDFGMANVEPPNRDKTDLVDLSLSDEIMRQDPAYGGTRVYMSPQQRSGTISGKNDVYSLGIILFEMSLMAETELSNKELISAIECLKHSTNRFPEFLDGPELIFVRRLISMMLSENCDYRAHVYHVQSLAAYRVCFATNKINFRYLDMTEEFRQLQGDWKEFVKFYTPKLKRTLNDTFEKIRSIERQHLSLIEKDRKSFKIIAENLNSPPGKMEQIISRRVGKEFLQFNVVVVEDEETKKTFWCLFGQSLHYYYDTVFSKLNTYVAIARNAHTEFLILENPDINNLAKEQKELLEILIARISMNSDFAAYVKNAQIDPKSEAAVALAEAFFCFETNDNVLVHYRKKVHTSLQNYTIATKPGKFNHQFKVIRVLRTRSYGDLVEARNLDEARIRAVVKYLKSVDECTAHLERIRNLNTRYIAYMMEPWIDTELGKSVVIVPFENYDMTLHDFVAKFNRSVDVATKNFQLRVAVKVLFFSLILKELVTSLAFLRDQSRNLLHFDLNLSSTFVNLLKGDGLIRLNGFDIGPNNGNDTRNDILDCGHCLQKIMELLQLENCNGYKTLEMIKYLGSQMVNASNWHRPHPFHLVTVITILIYFAANASDIESATLVGYMWLSGDVGQAMIKKFDLDITASLDDVLKKVERISDLRVRTNSASNLNVIAESPAAITNTEFKSFVDSIEVRTLSYDIFNNTYGQLHTDEEKKHRTTFVAILGHGMQMYFDRVFRQETAVLLSYGQMEILVVKQDTISPAAHYILHLLQSILVLRKSTIYWSEKQEDVVLEEMDLTRFRMNILSVLLFDDIIGLSPLLRRMVATDCGEPDPTVGFTTEFSNACANDQTYFSQHCYYVTLAALAQKLARRKPPLMVRELATTIKVPLEDESKGIDSIIELYKKVFPEVSYISEYQNHTTNLDTAVHKVADSMVCNSVIPCALCYLTTSNSGHVVVIKILKTKRGDVGFQCIDYQNSEGDDYQLTINDYRKKQPLIFEKNIPPPNMNPTSPVWIIVPGTECSFK